MNDIKSGVFLDHMIRQTRNHHVQLSSMADSKANMLMTTASVVLTLCVPYVMDTTLKYAAITLMIFCFLTIFLSVYAAMPKIPFLFRHKSPSEFTPSYFNLLFFGDFIHLKYDDYQMKMEKMMSSQESVYREQIKEIYFLGNFLAKKKFRFLRLAYITFLVGFITSGFFLFFS
ncbi:MAG: hypothetical protein GY699_02945 [Desulfobacteraceae bacterium]|nr:hypothetical protein [Desulfobacteraceae bacterium]